MNSIMIAGFGYSADISLMGGGLKGLWLHNQPVTTVFSTFEHRIGAEGDILAPFPGRINHGRYTWDGQHYELSLNEKSGEHAIHGFVRTLKWAILSKSDSEVTVGVDTQPVPGYPFRIRLQIQYCLTKHGLSITAQATNLSDARAPFAIGYHSYFVVGDPDVDTCKLIVPFDRVLEFEALIPTGIVLTVEEAGVDFRESRVIGKQIIDNCFVSPAETTPVVTLIGRDLEVDVWMDAVAYPNCVLFTGDTLVDERKRKAVAIEPMSCTSDGFNHPEWGLPILEPGGIWSGAWGICARQRSDFGS